MASYTYMNCIPCDQFQAFIIAAKIACKHKIPNSPRFPKHLEKRKERKKGIDVTNLLYVLVQLS
jgi:hypothetical protein